MKERWSEWAERQAVLIAVVLGACGVVWLALAIGWVFRVVADGLPLRG